GTLKGEQGLFDQVEAYGEKVLWIAEAYDYIYGRVMWHLQRAAVLVRKRVLDQALTAPKTGLLLADQACVIPVRLWFVGYKAINEALLGDTEAAQLSVGDGEIVISGLGAVAPRFLAPFSVGRLLTHIQLLKDSLESGSQSDILEHKRTTYRFARQAVRQSRKYAPYRTWILNLMGKYYWLIGKQGKAIKWWGKAIKEGARLNARPDLSRTYFEVGKRLLEPQSKYKELNGIDAKGYLEKAGILFEEMGLERDLEDLDRLKADYGL
ncbi:MAG: hypothetical protein MUP70_17805, partial [Candidatus Aminicenantes bacterium]|nr:hypothetical protein [Candidatus Aminicenantes bacterium]